MKITFANLSEARLVVKESEKIVSTANIYLSAYQDCVEKGKLGDLERDRNIRDNMYDLNLFGRWLKRPVFISQHQD
jgi:hypothetical protein